MTINQAYWLERAESRFAMAEYLRRTHGDLHDWWLTASWVALICYAANLPPTRNINRKLKGLS